MSENETETENGSESPKPAERRQPERRWRFDMLFVGLILIGLGGALLLATLNPDIQIRYLILTYWPLLLVAAGAVKILQALLGVRGGGSGLGLLVAVVIIMIIAAGAPWGWMHFELNGLGWFPPDYEYGETIGLEEGQNLELKAYRGKVVVYGHGGDDIELRVKAYVGGWDRKRAEKAAEDFKVDVSRSEAGVRIVSDPRRFAGGGLSVRVELEVGIPEGIVVKIVGDNAWIRVQDVNADVRIESRHGRVDVERSAGRVAVDIRNANVDLEYLDADVSVEGEHTDVDIEEVYGDITVKIGRGSVDLENRDRILGDIDINTARGSIDLEIDESSAVDFSASTDRGRISCDFLDFDKSGLRELNRSFNGGTYRVILRTGSGSISIDSD